MREIKHEQWSPIYESIPRLQKKEFIETLGYKHCYNFTNRFFITELEFEALKKYVDNYGISSKNTILEYLPFDGEQVTKHYNSLTKLMNSFEVQLLSPGDKVKLQAYHGHLFKQLN